MTTQAISIHTDEAAKLERVANILKTIAHPMRLSIVHLLEKHQRLTVTEICDTLNSEQSLTSHHLQTMRLNGVLDVKRQGRCMYYSLKRIEVSRLIECIEKCPHAM